MSKGKFLSKLNIFKKKKKISRDNFRSNTTTGYHSSDNNNSVNNNSDNNNSDNNTNTNNTNTNTNNTMETIPEIVRGKTFPIPSTNKESLDSSSVHSNKRKSVVHSNVEDIESKKKQPNLGVDLDKPSSSTCSIPTPVVSATTTSSCHNITNPSETNTKENNISSTPISMCGDEQDLEAVATPSSSSNDKKINKMKEAVVESESELESESDKSIPKISISSEVKDKNVPSTSSIQNENNNLDTPPHTPTIFVTSISSVSSVVAGGDNSNENNEINDANPTPKNETKSHADEFDLYVEDVFNRLALDANISPEAETEASTNRYNRAATEESDPDDPLVSEPLTINPGSNNVFILQRGEPQVLVIPSNPSPHLNNVQIHLEETNHDTNPPATNTNTKKESYNNDILVKKNNETKKEKKIDDDTSSRDKENKTNENKAKNNDIEKYLEKENTHSIAESMEVLNNTIDMLKCGICLDILLDPKIVEPCGHSFCNHCLRLLQTRICPLCRTRIHDYHSSVLLNELSELIAKFSLNKEQLEERHQCCQEIEEKDKHLNDECLRLMELMELAHQPENTNNYTVQFHELVELNETDDDI